MTLTGVRRFKRIHLTKVRVGPRLSSYSLGSGKQQNCSTKRGITFTLLHFRASLTFSNAARYNDPGCDGQKPDCTPELLLLAEYRPRIGLALAPNESSQLRSSRHGIRILTKMEKIHYPVEKVERKRARITQTTGSDHYCSAASVRQRIILILEQASPPFSLFPSAALQPLAFCKEGWRS